MMRYIMNCFIRSRFLKAALKIGIMWVKLMAAIFGSVAAIAFVVAGILVFFEIDYESKSAELIFTVVFVSYVAAAGKYIWDRID